MIETLRRNPVIAALAAVCALLAGIVAFELFAPAGPAAPAAPRKAASAEAKLLPPVATASAEQVYPETVNRPLWIPTRRPAPAAQVAAPASFPKGQYTLQGVIVAGTTRIAMLREKTSGRVHRVEKGRELNGIRVAEVEPESVTLAQGDDREVIELRVQRPGAPGAPPAAPATAAAGTGPFAGVGPRGPAPGTPPGTPPGVAVPPAPSAPPPGNPFGSIPRPPQTSPGPLAPVPGANPANPASAAVPQDPSAAPMTPEELLARRRARRNQSP